MNIVCRPQICHSILYKKARRGLGERNKSFTADGGRLYYVGGEKSNGNENPCLVMENAEERRIIIHSQAHMGRDKTSSEISSRYYCPELYNDVFAHMYVYYSLNRLFNIGYLDNLSSH